MLSLKLARRQEAVPQIKQHYNTGVKKKEFCGAKRKVSFEFLADFHERESTSAASSPSSATVDLSPSFDCGTKGNTLTVVATEIVGRAAVVVFVIV